jgi:hypothetical protein
MFLMNNKFFALPLLLLFALIMRCTITPLAGGSDNPDFIVTGAVVDTSGQPVQNAVVTIAPASYNPVADAALAASMTDTTDANGTYRLTVKQKGAYTMQAIHHQAKTRLLVTGIFVTSDTNHVAAATLRATGTIKIFLLSKGINSTTGYIYVPGTSLCALLYSRSDTIMMDSVPCGTLPSISYSATDAVGSIDLRYNVSVASGDTAIIYNPAWKHARSISINTTVSGAGVTGNVSNFPALIRLNAGNFDFLQTKTGGVDIRFTKPNNTPLSFEIERWDSVNHVAELWVKIDTVLGNDSSQSIMMYWGNDTASDISNSASVFDTANGFLGVWHMSEDPSTGTGSIKDRTANKHDATPFGSMTSSNSVDGAAGKALSFDGIDDYLNAGNVSVPKNYSLGLWVLLDTLGDYQRFIYKDSTYTLWYDKDSVSVRMEHMSATTWWRGLLQDGGTHITMITGAWYYFIGTFDGTAIRLYENGTEVSRSNAISVIPITNSKPLFFGQSKNNSFVKGIMDEIRIEGTARSADWIKLCYMNQQKVDKIIVFK